LYLIKPANTSGYLFRRLLTGDAAGTRTLINKSVKISQ